MNKKRGLKKSFSIPLKTVALNDFLLLEIC